jgi:hypothetical protein
MFYKLNIITNTNHFAFPLGGRKSRVGGNGARFLSEVAGYRGAFCWLFNGFFNNFQKDVANISNKKSVGQWATPKTQSQFMPNNFHGIYFMAVRFHFILVCFCFIYIFFICYNRTVKAIFSTLSKNYFLLNFLVRWNIFYSGFLPFYCFFGMKYVNNESGINHKKFVIKVAIFTKN